jgi:hypothetical protein
MATPPHLVSEDGEPKLDVSVGQSGRQQFALSDRAEGMLVDDLGYGNRDTVPWVTTKALALAGGIYLRESKSDARELSWAITGADGGANAADAELERVADYLRAVEIDDHAVETLREFVRESALAGVVAPEAIDSKRDRLTDLRGIAKEL